MNFRIWALGHEFVGCADVRRYAGVSRGPWEDSYPTEIDVVIEEIYMKLDGRERRLDFRAMDHKSQDVILGDIAEEYNDEARRIG